MIAVIPQRKHSMRARMPEWVHERERRVVTGGLSGAWSRINHTFTGQKQKDTPSRQQAQSRSRRRKRGSEVGGRGQYAGSDALDQWATRLGKRASRPAYRKTARTGGNSRGIPSPCAIPAFPALRREGSAPPLPAEPRPLPGAPPRPAPHGCGPSSAGAQVSVAPPSLR